MPPYHDVHSRGLPKLVDKIPGGPTEKVYAAYQQAPATGKHKHMVAHPGDVLPVTLINVTVI